MTPPRGQVVLVRHGETDWSRAGRHTGHTDIPLNQAGRRQAGRLLERLAGRRFARVLTSPASRAFETCELAGLAEGAERVDDLREWDYGAYEGLTSDQIRAQVPQWSIWKDGVSGGETLADVVTRADRVIALLAGVSDALGAPTGNDPIGNGPTGDAPTGDGPTGDVVVFAHGHLLRVLAARWVGLEPGVGSCLALYAGSLSTLGWEHEHPVLATWNDVDHLIPGRSGFRPSG